MIGDEDVAFIVARRKDSINPFSVTEGVVLDWRKNPDLRWSCIKHKRNTFGTDLGWVVDVHYRHISNVPGFSYWVEIDDWNVYGNKKQFIKDIVEAKLHGEFFDLRRPQ
jgi:hypothetical protein